MQHKVHSCTAAGEADVVFKLNGTAAACSLLCKVAMH